MGRLKRKDPPAAPSAADAAAPAPANDKQAQGASTEAAVPKENPAKKARGASKAAAPPPSEPSAGQSGDKKAAESNAKSQEAGEADKDTSRTKFSWPDEVIKQLYRLAVLAGCVHVQSPPSVLTSLQGLQCSPRTAWGEMANVD